MKVNSIHKDVGKFIDDLDQNVWGEVFKAIDLLEDKGADIRMPYSKKVVKDIYELRIISTQNIRIFYTFRNHEIFLLHAINKKSQRLIKKDIEKAIHRERWLHSL